MEGDDYYAATDTLPWGTDSDYFEPTTPVVTETEFAVTEAPQTSAPGPLGAEGAPGEKTGSADETSSSSPMEKGTVNSVPNPTKGNLSPATNGPNKLETPPQDEAIEDATEIPVTEKEGLIRENSSSSSLGKGTINLTKEVSEGTATSPVLLSKGTPSVFLGKEPEATELVTDAYSGVKDPALPSVTSSTDLLASTSGEERVVPLSAAGATEETGSGSGLGSTIPSWEETANALSGPNDDSLEPSPDANTEASVPSLSSDSPSDSEVLSGNAPSPPPEGDAATAEQVLPPERPSSGSTSTSDTISGSLEPSEPATVSLQPSPEGKGDPGVEPAPAKGRGDVDSFTATALDAAPATNGSSTGLEVNPAGTAKASTEGPEDLAGAEASGSSPGDGAADTPPGSASSSDTSSSSPGLDFGATAASPKGILTAPDSSSSSPSPEDGEMVMRWQLKLKEPLEGQPYLRLSLMHLLGLSIQRVRQEEVLPVELREVLALLKPASTSSSGAKATKPAASSISSLPPSSSKSKPVAEAAKGTSSKSSPNEPDARVAASGAGLSPAESAQTSSKSSNKKPEAARQKPKKEKQTRDSDESTSDSDESRSKERPVPAALIPVPAGVPFRGLWPYKLPGYIQLNYGRRCLQWLSHEWQPSAWNKDLPRCPCSLRQALSDSRYRQSKKGFLDSELIMLYSSTPNKYGAGVRCVYNNHNQLVEGHQERIWKNSRINSPYKDEELKLYDWCCNQAGNSQFCDKYNQMRPKVGCDGYRSSARSAKCNLQMDCLTHGSLMAIQVLLSGQQA
ncbi:hypothetical protein lerEdw1_005099 [Lerista edwardsae]|nr:hypothetical protein lerEdw1_005099 [Lerista edwardsae]